MTRADNCVVIALDAMSGDFGLESTLNGIKYFIKNYNDKNVFFNIFGNKATIEEVLDINNDIYKIYDTGNNIIDNNEKPAHAIRNSSGTSMYEAISSVTNGISDCVVSSGNTGAYMALSKMIIGTLSGISRPALVNLLPCENGSTIMLDLGANIECSAAKLYQFAIMGNAVAKSLLNIEHPKIGILNIGTEKVKGTEVLEETYELLSKNSDLNFNGFIEGNDITKGTVHVVVTDGFSGNIALKSIEGSVKFILSLLKNEIESSIVAKLGCASIIKSLKNKLNPSEYNGAPFVGLNGIVVKSHGNSDAHGVAHAMHTAVSLVESNFLKHIKESLEVM